MHILIQSKRVFLNYDYEFSRLFDWNKNIGKGVPVYVMSSGKEVDKVEFKEKIGEWWKST